MKHFLFLFLSLFSFSVIAQNVHYFGSVTAAKSTVDDNDFSFDSIKNKVTVSPLTTAGFSFNASLSDRYQVLAQFIYKNQRSIGVDLLQMRSTLAPGLVLRAGRQRLPTNLHSENIQVQALLPWVTAPREVYGRTPIYSFTGASIEKSFGDNIILHLYGGDTYDLFIQDTVEYKSAAKNMVGGRLNLQLDNFNAFVNLYRAEAALDIKSNVDISQVLTSAQNTNLNFLFSKNHKLENINGLTAGYQYRPKDFFIMSEYSMLSSDNPLIERIEGAYATLGKELGEKWVAVATFSTDLGIASQLSPSKTATYAYNMNYRLDLNNMIKFGFEHINYKELTVATANGSSNASVFTNGAPEENFDIYSVMWAFVY